MSDQPTVTERQAVERERGAYVRGYLDGDPDKASLAAWVAVDTRYPLPKVRRLRECVMGDATYRYNPATGRFEFMSPRMGRWCDATFIPVAAIGLKLNPWGEVDA